MSNVIDELKVVFSAETGGLSEGLAQIGAQLETLEGMSGAAQNGLAALAEAFAGGLAGISGDAYGAGADAGAAFARGLRASAGSVQSAAAYLSATAAGSLGSGYSGSGGAGMTGFDSSIMSGGTGAAVSGSGKAVEITVPLNVDGVKLGEACIRALDRVSGMTGRAHAVI